MRRLASKCSRAAAALPVCAASRAEGQEQRGVARMLVQPTRGRAQPALGVAGQRTVAAHPGGAPVAFEALPKRGFRVPRRIVADKRIDVAQQQFFVVAERLRHHLPDVAGLRRCRRFRQLSAPDVAMHRRHVRGELGIECGREVRSCLPVLKRAVGLEQALQHHRMARRLAAQNLQRRDAGLPLSPRLLQFALRQVDHEGRFRHGVPGLVQNPIPIRVATRLVGGAGRVQVAVERRVHPCGSAQQRVLGLLPAALRQQHGALQRQGASAPRAATSKPAGGAPEAAR